MPLGLALLSAAFPPERRGTAIGIFSAITGLAVASGPLVGGAVVEGLAWQWIFWINVPIGLRRGPARAARACARATAPDTALDIPGLALVTGGALGVVWALVRGNTVGWGSPEVIGVARRRRAAGRRVRRLGAARAPSRCCRCASSARAAFSAGNAAIFFTFASLFGGGVLLRPAPADRARLRPARRRAAAAAVDGDVHDRRAGRRRAGRPHRRAAAAWSAGLALQAAGMAWLALIAEPGIAYSQHARAAHRRRRRRLDGDPGGAELGRRLGRAWTRSARPPAPTA